MEVDIKRRLVRTFLLPRQFPGIRQLQLLEADMENLAPPTHELFPMASQQKKVLDRRQIAPLRLAT
jgi:hypothetical protein